MSVKYFIYYLLFLFVHHIYGSEYSIILTSKLTFYSEQGKYITDKKTVINFDNDGYLNSLISKDINITVTHEENSYDLFFQDNEGSWHQKMIHADNCWSWFNDEKLICNIYYSDAEKCIGSDSTKYTVELKEINNQIIINLGAGRNFVLDISTKNEPVFNNSRDVSKLKRINNTYSYTDYFDSCSTEYIVEIPPFSLDYSQIAFLIPALFHIEYDFYPFVTGVINKCYGYAYHASSYLSEGVITYEPEHLQQKDGLPWASGNGKGIGDVISLKEFEHENPTELVIMNGYQDRNHPEYYDKNSRVKCLKVTNMLSKKSKTITVKDIKEVQRFSIKELGAGNEYKFEILDVYSGNKYNDLCIQYLVVE